MIDEVEAFARRNPPLFLGAAFGLGVLAVRFLKSSRQQQAGGASSGYQRGGSDAYQDGSSGTDQGTGAGAYARDVPSGVS